MSSDIENRQFLDNEVRPLMKDVPKIMKSVSRSHENRHILADFEQRLKRLEKMVVVAKEAKSAPKKASNKKG